jgi:hypothetical protein
MNHAALLPGPPLGRWLARELEVVGERRRVGLWLAALGGAGLYGRAAAAALEGLDLRPIERAQDLVEDEPFGALVVVTPLGDDVAVPSSVFAALAAGAAVIEIAHPPAWRLREVVWPWARWERQRWAIERRARAWALAGAYALRQWSPLEPEGLVVTEGRRRAIPAR